MMLEYLTDTVGVRTAFVLLAAAAGLLYGLQGSLLAKYARSHSGLTTAAMRNLSFVITMSPVLYFVPPAAWAALSDTTTLGWLALTCLCGATALTAMLNSQQHLPIGMSSAFGQTTPLAVVAWAALLVGQRIGSWQLAAMMALLLAVYFLATTRSVQSQRHNLKQGVPLVLLAAVVGGLGFFALGRAAQSLHPLLLGYLWEIGIGTLLAIVLLGRWLLLPSHRAPRTLSWRQAGQIALFATPTVVASILLPTALTLGTAGVALAINGAAGIIITVLLGGLLYGEHLRGRQIFLIGIIIVAMVGVRMAG